MESIDHIVLEKSVKKLKLSGKKYDMIPQERTERWSVDRPARNHSNNTFLMFSKNKEDIMKRVLGQIQIRIKELGTY